MAKTKSKHMEEYMTVNEAMPIVRETYPWVTDFMIREAIREGKIDHERLSDKPRARIRVTPSAILEYVKNR